MEHLGLALAVALLAHERGGAAQERLRRVELVAQAGGLGAVHQRARVRFERGARQRVGEGGERGERARRNPRAAVLGNRRGGAVEVFRREQVAHGLLPLLARQEVRGDARVLGGDPLPPGLDAEAALEEAAEERVQAVLFAARVRRERDEDVAPRERLKQRRVVRLGVEVAARLRLDAFEQRDAQKKLPHVLRLVGEDLFGEVVEDVALGLAQDFDEVGRGGRTRRPARDGLPLRDLPDELQRRDPAVRALAVLGELFGRQLEVEDVAEKLPRLFVREEEFRAVDDRERSLRP